ncbi:MULTISPECIES: SDR family oxidoreductase [Bradyrhizobium]|uniref:SDR family oxidoreductase n=1 Tax=Bradyrhizobium TaxID=374 RepID=UPI000413E0B0|nr:MULTISPECIES: SDR family oxidoreductase [Bradyrhizobium]QOG21896.1 SDR family oxidoreductase [Bradyrhizobium sp. SEMIA]UFW47457.1 SDR family oxidoreductase [Bradyrhizobium arachidis]
MDLGLRGRKAIVCAASQGLGKASAMALAREGVDVVIVARRREVLDSAAREIELATGNRPQTVLADVTSREGRDAILSSCPGPDILINNAGGPPPGDFRSFERDDWIRALDGNMLAPIALIKSTIDGMVARKFGRIVNITSHAVKAPVAMLALSNGARSGLSGFIAGLARSVAEHNVTVNNLLPGTFDTDRLRSNLTALARNSSRSVAEVTEEVRASNPSKRFGHPDEFGATCAFLCSAQASYITGQNILIDGGAYPGTF